MPNNTGNNFVSKDPKSNFSPISSIDDFSELSPENKIRRKLVVVDGSHVIINQDDTELSIFFRNFFEYSFENCFQVKY